MNFDSAFFLFCFFPVLAIAYALLPGRRARNALLVAAGLVFYSFGALFDLLLLLAMAAVNYGFGLLLRRDRGRRAVLAAGVAADLAVLCGFKLLERVAVTVTGADGLLYFLFARHSPVTLTVPLGISFFTFKCVSYLVDTYRDRERGTRSFWRLLAYVSFFPQILSGPITRFPDFDPQLDSRAFTADGTARGLTRLVRGLAKKLLLAAAAGSVADAIFALDSGALDIRLAWLGAAAYALQLFFDFSGYSDMAIGLGQFFGFETAENFNFPYAAASITEFWRRWHMSLSGWFKDYLYIPLGGNRKGKWRAALNKFIVFVLCGLWHGLGVTFLLWGAWHGLLAALETLGVIDVKRLRRTLPGRALCHVYALLAVVLGFVMFRAGTAAQGFAVIAAMFTGFHGTVAGTVLLHRLLDGRTVCMLLLGVVFSLPVGPWVRERLAEKRWAAIGTYGLYAALFVLCLTELAAGGFAPFIYAQF